MGTLRDWFTRRSAKRKLVHAQAEFDATARALVEANRAARARGEKITPDMLIAAEKNSVALQYLLNAQRDSEKATGGPDPVELTETVRHKVCQLFSGGQQAIAIRLLEKECGHSLPIDDRASPKDLDRVRLAVLKLSGGKLSELRRQIEVARMDWRDVLGAAEQPEALKMGFLEYAKLPSEERHEIDARDRQQYDSWLGDEAR